MSDDHDEDFTDDFNRACPECGHKPTRWKDCDVFNCEDGLIDEHADDPINFAPGREFRECDACCGTGAIHWCPKCGFELTGMIIP